MAWAGIHGEMATFQIRAVMEIIPYLYTIAAPKSTSNGPIVRVEGACRYNRFGNIGNQSKSKIKCCSFTNCPLSPNPATVALNNPLYG
jgi:hypothetical protein